MVMVNSFLSAVITVFGLAYFFLSLIDNIAGLFADELEESE